MTQDTSAANLQFRYDPIPSDHQTVEAIVRSTGFFSPDEVDVAVELVDQRLLQGLASGYYFVFAERDGRTLGYGCYGPIAATVGSYDFYWLAVDKGCQNQGLGRAMRKEIERRIREAGGRRIYIETSNRAQYAPTRAFHERSGYRQEAILKDFYADGDDKVIYVKTL